MVFLGTYLYLYIYMSNVSTIVNTSACRKT